MVTGLVVLLGGVWYVTQSSVASQAEREAPRFEVDPFWPKPLPNGWLMGSTIGLWVDEQDHVWVIHRGADTLDGNEGTRELDPPTAPDCCSAAPPVLEFDPEGNLVSSWGGPGEGWEWPTSNHGITLDDDGNVWIGGNGAGDSHILVFTRAGEFVMQIGRAEARRGPDGPNGNPTYVGDSTDQESFGRVAEVWIDNEANEVYVADGYLNRRIAVLDGDTGVIRRQWGAYGNPVDDTNNGAYDPAVGVSETFRNPVHCVALSNDDLVYMCDRVNNRIQVFQTDGTFVEEVTFSEGTLGAGAAWDVAFSVDPEQRFLYVADGLNRRVRIFDRASLELLTSFGDGGRQPGQFFGVHNLNVDSAGNLYTVETWEGKRLQKFVNMGIEPVTVMDQGTPWPAAAR
jgi:DNA-binding beta-propeller fold protein YncE